MLVKPVKTRIRLRTVWLFRSYLSKQSLRQRVCRRVDAILRYNRNTASGMSVGRRPHTSPFGISPNHRVSIRPDRTLPRLDKIIGVKSTNNKLFLRSYGARPGDRTRDRPVMSWMLYLSELMAQVTVSSLRKYSST